MHRASYGNVRHLDARAVSTDWKLSASLGWSGRSRCHSANPIGCRYVGTRMEVFRCGVCARPIEKGEAKGIAVIFRTSDPRRRPMWGPSMILAH
jgi:hypothetical protein